MISAAERLCSFITHCKFQHTPNTSILDFAHSPNLCYNIHKSFSSRLKPSLSTGVDVVGIQGQRQVRNHVGVRGKPVAFYTEEPRGDEYSSLGSVVVLRTPTVTLNTQS
jgi:hypothetical protein